MIAKNQLKRLLLRLKATPQLLHSLGQDLKAKIKGVHQSLGGKAYIISQRLRVKLRTVVGDKMIGPIEKGFKRAKFEAPQGSYEEVDLSVLPKYICYKAALLREKLTLYYILTALLLLFMTHYLVSRLEIANLHGKLREKEYILAPGVMDFTKASPHIVPNAYIHDAAMDFLSSLGNISAANIDEQYASIRRFMSQNLRVRFDVDTADWVEQVKADYISQIFKITELEVTSDLKGAYQVVATGRVDFYANQQYLGYEDQVIQMVLKLVPPESGKRWYLQITSLQWEKAETFQTKSRLSQSRSSIENSETSQPKHQTNQ